MAEDFGDEDVLGHVFGFKAFDADGGVGRAQVAWFPAQIALSEGGLDLGIDGVLGGDMGAVGVGVGR
jgi:hypothetical protein